MVESSGLLNRRRGLNLYRGFESPPLRQIKSFTTPPPEGVFLLESGPLWGLLWGPPVELGELRDSSPLATTVPQRMVEGKGAGWSRWPERLTIEWLREWVADLAGQIQAMLARICHDRHGLNLAGSGVDFGVLARALFGRVALISY